MATPRIAAGALIRHRDGRPLLVRPTYKDGWDIPGGYVEPGESPAAACERELSEELGITLRPGRLLVIDWAPHPDEGDKLLAIFDAGHMSEDDLSRLRLAPDEIAEARFHPADDLPALLPDRLARRVRLAIAAADQGTTTYAEHGQAR